MSGRSLPTGFVSSVLHNGVGRYVCQLKRLTIQMCLRRPDSKGTRDFVEKELIEFSRAHPEVAVYVQPRRHHVPSLVGEYLNGETKRIVVAKKSCAEICQWVEHLRTQSGIPSVRWYKMNRTDHPTVQGTWHPFLNAPTDLLKRTLPAADNNDFDNDPYRQPTAEEMVIAMAEKQ